MLLQPLATLGKHLRLAGYAVDLFKGDIRKETMRDCDQRLGVDGDLMIGKGVERIGDASSGGILVRDQPVGAVPCLYVPEYRSDISELLKFNR